MSTHAGSLLMDTHAYLWWVLNDPRLPARVIALVRDADEVYVSAATAWEIRTKYRLGKLPDAAQFVGKLAEQVRADRFRELPVTFADGDVAGGLVQAHKDPFDRMLAAQAINYSLRLVSSDAALDAFGVVRVW